MTIIIHFTNTLSEASGGVAASVKQLVYHLNQLDPDKSHTILCPAQQHNFRDSRQGSSRLVSIYSIFYKLIDVAIRFLDLAYRATGLFSSKKVSAVCVSGLWLPSGVMVQLIAHIFDIPVVIYPRGMLMPYSLQQSKYKKLIAWHMYQRFLIHSAAALVTTSEYEKENLPQRYASSEKVFNCGNASSINLTATQFESYLHQRARYDHKSFLYLSRVHPQKGIDTLLTSWQQLSSISSALLIYGAVDKEYSHIFYESIAMHSNNPILYSGFVDGEAKLKALREASFFILPTFSENFGVSILEALACGLPVITSEYTPWSSTILREQCGFIVDPSSPSSIAEAIYQALSLSIDQYKRMSRQSYSLSLNYNWNSVANQTLETFESL